MATACPLLYVIHFSRNEQPRFLTCSILTAFVAGNSTKPPESIPKIKDNRCSDVVGTYAGSAYISPTLLIRLDEDRIYFLWTVLFF